ncbi:MAG: hypothetical protein HN350_01615 [Phycisphaerales bacterium]|nr:hypothetical protein [Phycisphaerales bacterium]
MSKLLATSLVMIAVTLSASVSSVQGAYTPWDTLTNDSWMDDNNASTPSLRMYAANNTVEYRVSFGGAKNSKASGMKAIRFDETDSHHQTTNQTGTFTLKKTGAAEYTTILVLVAVDANTLPANFACTLNGYAFDRVNDFAYYDPAALGYDTGRPAGYYSATNPTSEPIAHTFDSGMVSLMAIENILFTQNNPITVSYAFENLPGAAAFNIYGMQSDLQGQPTDIYHTNTGVQDLNNPTQGVTSFTVLPEPTSITLLGCMAIALLRKRRKA